MGRSKTENIPDLSALLTPKNQLMLAVEQAVLRGHEWTRASAPIAEQIAARLAGVITLDLVHAGQRLLEKDISEVLRVSRAPVREALRILERDRLVEFQARRGALVTAPDADELRDIFAVRAALYAILLEQVMQERPADLAAVFDEHMPALERATAESSVDGYAVASFLLNFAIADLCSNRLLVDLLKSIALRTLRYVRLGLAGAPALLPNSVKSWRALARAVARGDVTQVLETAARRIADTRDAAVRAIEPPARRARAARQPLVQA
ncbi:MAG: GntR family transcriptional regulator [Burkholderiales bacterium]|nr:GntR family transcriptional regulator [Burkholderiales bacterium]